MGEAVDKRSNRATQGKAMKAIIYLLVAMALVACGGGETTSPIPSTTAAPVTPSIAIQSAFAKTGEACLRYMNGDNSVGPVESTPIVWGGKVLLVTGNSRSGVSDGSARIDSFDCKTSIASVQVPGFHYLNAFVNNGTMYLFGSVSGQMVQMVSSTDPALQVWTAPQVVLDMPVGMSVFNTSISATTSGFIMALEVLDAAYPDPFVTHFATSTDLQLWSILPNVLRHESRWTNCPWIWYNAADGYYYVMYLTQVNGQGETLITRSLDLNTWQAGNASPFIASQGEGNNNSDVAVMELNGMSYFVYARGDQTYWLELATATYSGTLDRFVHLFF